MMLRPRRTAAARLSASPACLRGPVTPGPRTNWADGRLPVQQDRFTSAPLPPSGPTDRAATGTPRAATLRPWAALLVLLLGWGCGGGRPRPVVDPRATPSASPPPVLVVVDPPEDDLVKAIAFRNGGPRMFRPELDRAYAVELGPTIRRPYAEALLGVIQRATRNRVGFVFDSGRPAEITFRVDPTAREVQDPAGGVFAGVAVLRQEGPFARGGDVIFGDQAWADSPKVFLHEALHAALGFGHAPAEVCPIGCVMGGAPLEQDWLHPGELLAWNWMEAHASGAVLRGHEGRAATAAAGPACRLPAREMGGTSQLSQRTPRPREVAPLARPRDVPSRGAR